MWYHFDSNGNCVCSSSGKINPVDEIVASVWCDTKYDDIYNVRLVDGKVEHVEEENDDTNNLSTGGNPGQ